MKFNDWKDNLIKFPEGRIWFNNYKFDVYSGNLNKDTVDEFLQAFVDINDDISDGDIKQIVERVLEIFHKVLNTVPNCFNLRGSPHSLPYASFSRIMTIKDFSQNNIDKHKLGIPMDDFDDINVWEYLGTIIKPKHYKGFLRTGKIFFWCTNTHDIDSLKANYDGTPSDLALNIRNKLGLAHFGSNQHLIEIIVEKEKLSGKIVCSPTSFDVGIEGCFWIPSKDIGFGKTLDFSCNKEGVEEVIIEQIPFTADYTVNKIGIIPNSTSLPVPDISLLEKLSEERVVQYER